MGRKCYVIQVYNIFEVSLSKRRALIMLPLGIIEFLYSYIVSVFSLIDIEAKTHNDLSIWLKSSNDWVVRLVTS